uniref:Bulb-type lectin domain-containing protein n=1 Tax=Solanum lycopersicum TaxID=4081 RepID=A0A3Q7HDD7_SOLLC
MLAQDSSVASTAKTMPPNVFLVSLCQDGNLVLTDSDGTPVWSTNTTGKSVSGLNMTETGNLVLFDKDNQTIWQSFNHPTDTLLPEQSLVSGRKITASVSSDNSSQDNPYFSFDGDTFTALHPTNSTAQFVKIEPNGHLKVYQWSVMDWNELDITAERVGNCGYPMVCGRYSICTNNGQCACPPQENFFRPSSERKPDLGCSQLTSIYCNSCSTIVS